MECAMKPRLGNSSVVHGFEEMIVRVNLDLLDTKKELLDKPAPRYALTARFYYAERWPSGRRQRS
jgi:hypothetical protein